MVRNVSFAVVALMAALALSSLSHGDSSDSKRISQEQLRANVDAALKYLAAAEQALTDEDYESAQRSLARARGKLETLRELATKEKKVAYFTEKTATEIEGHTGRVSVKVVDPTGVTRSFQLVIFPSKVPGEGWVQRSFIPPRKGVTTRSLYFGNAGYLKEDFRVVLYDVSRAGALPIGHIKETNLEEKEVEAVDEILIRRTK